MSEQKADYIMSDKETVINFLAQIYKIQTLIDGGVRVTLDLVTPSDKTILQLFSAKNPGVFLDLAGAAVERKD